MSFLNSGSHSKLPNVGTTIFTLMGNLAKQHQAINLSQGFPDFDSDPKLLDLVTKAMKNGFNQYAPLPGVLALREQIAQKYEDLYGASYHPVSEITITAGATEAIFSIIATFINKDDEVLIFNPAYDCYVPTIKLFKGVPIYVQLEAPGFKVDWEVVKSLISSKTKMIIINSPHNPCGTIWDKEDLLALENLVKNTNILVLSDEVYEHIIYDGKTHQSACLFPGLKERSFVVGSFGKTFHNTGWKIGYCAAPAALMAEFIKVHQYNVFCVNHPMQIALAEYLKEAENYRSLNQFYEEKRDFFLGAIQGSRFTFKPSQGTYFQLLDYSAISQENDTDFAIRLTKEFKIASIPISPFNAAETKGKNLRFCFAKKKETLEKAAAILCSI